MDGAFAVPGLSNGEVAGDGAAECEFIADKPIFVEGAVKAEFIADKPIFVEGAVKDEFDFIDALEVVSGGSSGIFVIDTRSKGG